MPTKNVTWEQIYAKIGEIGRVAEVPDATLYRIITRNPTLGTQECIQLTRETGNLINPSSDSGYYAIGSYSRREENRGITLNHFTGFRMYPFPGCCALCISSGAFVRPGFTQRGINKLCLQLRELIAAFTGYTGLICTDKANNIPSIRTIEGAGFQKLYDLQNRRTRNKVNIYIKDLDK
jgi:hypothetical protein